ncbi:von Willebrand factor type A domain-containing protein [Echria macrotheca]|uniref:von Willebrand factor type A domain-containing protein n=1 Tax=Echria macrotheca TaxID=438768 RepID=A0AAJ0BGA0_9PEZI|nr:von Willebrand factor type A domain-containing protein [Echria macrotheca]
MTKAHICGLYYLVPCAPGTWPNQPDRKYLPQLSLSVHATIIASTSRTTLTQTFANPSKDKEISELRYTFPLYDGVSVVGFVCTINKDRVIRGIVKERAEARQTYEAAVARGETAGLLEQLPDASDVFTTTIGNVPAGAEIKVDITYLGELKHDAEADGIRFTIPTSIAPRYGSYPGEMLQATELNTSGGINIIVDAEMPQGCNIKSVQSPSHPISVTVGNTSVGAASGADMSLQKASATLSLGTTELGKDFILHVVATNTGNPIAVLETHPTIPSQRALMATLVPKFNLPSSKPEIVFLCDRSGSMGGGNKVSNMKTALHIFLKSLPVGVKFNICSFGSRYEFLFKNGSRTYDASSLKEAAAYVDTFGADFGGTDIYRPMEDVFKKRFTDMDLEVFLLTDGEIWDHQLLFNMINTYNAGAKGAIRVFTLGIGSDVSHALIEGVARAGNGFSQSVGDSEKMSSKVVRMLKASLTPHVNDYTLEIKYGQQGEAEEEDFEIVEKVMDALTLDIPEPKPEPEAKKPISLFDTSADADVHMADASLDMSAGGKYSHVPPVAEPKFLQAPFEIPPLFPFSRTSVYLLMSSESVQKTPKSVVLRGTSRYGPLELEIPVTALAGKGETLHQLAAKKAVQELEEGRGWLYHAKDSSGELFKDKLPGHFNDMVEREAVRLGVRYQVGGKWCSFVAVDETTKETKDALVPLPYAMQSAEYSKQESCSTSSLFGAAPPPPPATRGYQKLALSAAPPPPPATRGPPRSFQMSARDNSRDRSFGGRGDSSFGCRGHPQPAPAPGGSFGALQAVSGSGRLAKAQPPMAQLAAPKMYLARSDRDDRNTLDLSLSSTRARGSKMRKSARGEDYDDYVPAVSRTDILEAIVALQDFSGSWPWSVELLGLLGLDEAGVAARAAQLGGVFSVGSTELATALVLGFLESKLTARKDEWEMLADKARDWLDGETRGAVAAGEYVDKVKGVFF